MIVNFRHGSAYEHNARFIRNPGQHSVGFSAFRFGILREATSVVRTQEHLGQHHNLCAFSGGVLRHFLRSRKVLLPAQTDFHLEQPDRNFLHVRHLLACIVIHRPYAVNLHANLDKRADLG
ncbi:hypothetical protein SDC9_212731 [bioreactor metagenome]|uniref:Uncharacterized protein n=1 Tax=bioreactor metagenome TaxID=1076179 RepID=A0A645JNT1_9ZZZZ